MKKVCIGILAAAMVFCSGCSIRIVDETKPQYDPSKQGPALSYGYCIGNFDYVDTDIRYYLNKFGDPELLQPADDQIITYTEIPAVENNAKGTDPLCIVLPNIDHSQYVTGESYDDPTGNLNICPYYRIIDGMVTDECILIYIDHAGTILKYETVNDGRYDLTAEQQNNLAYFQNLLEERIDSKLHSLVFEKMSPTLHQAPSVYSVITDAQGRTVIYCTAILKSDEQYLKVDLYGIAA